MPKTKKAMRDKKKKVLTKRMKEQTRNAAMIVKRIAKIKKDIWKLELADFKELGLLPQLTWNYVDRVSLFGCTAIGFRSTETTLDSKVVKKIQKWIQKREDKEFRDARLYRKSIDGYTVLLSLQMDWVDDEAIWDEESDPMAVTIFAIDVQETGTGHKAEEVALKQFAEEWKIEATIDV
jgi:hypothetical protein